MANDLQLNKNAVNATDKSRILVLSILLDVIGMATYLIPALGEFGDIIWAPIAGFIMTQIYKGFSGRAAGFFTFLEEIIPFTDFIPTFTLMWLYTYKIKRQQ